MSALNDVYAYVGKAMLTVDPSRVERLVVEVRRMANTIMVHEVIKDPTAQLPDAYEKTFEEFKQWVESIHF